MITKEEVFDSPYPSATRLTRMFTPAQLSKGIPAHALKNATNKGTAFHKFAQEYVDKVQKDKEPYIPVYDLEYIEYEQQFVEWFNEIYDPEDLYDTEMAIIDDDLRIKGFIDLVIYQPRKKLIQVVDYKTSAQLNKFSYPMQVQIYMELAYNNLDKIITNVEGTLVQFTKTKYKEVSVSMAPEGMVKGLSDTFAEYEEIFRKEDKKKS